MAGADAQLSRSSSIDRCIGNKAGEKSGRDRGKHGVGGGKEGKEKKKHEFRGYIEFIT